MPREARAEGLSRRHRFTVQGSFGAILRNSRKLRTPHVVLHVAPGRPGVSRLGIALARRTLPSSVDRNRVKRIVRDVFRRHPVKHAGLDLVVSFRARPGDDLGAALVRLFDDAQGLADDARGIER
jgi:ribonuclease P protein component